MLSATSFLHQPAVSCWRQNQSALVCQWHNTISVNKVLLEEVQIILNIRQKVLVALGSRRDRSHGSAQPQLHICVGGLGLRTLRGVHSIALITFNSPTLTAHFAGHALDCVRRTCAAGRTCQLQAPDMGMRHPIQSRAWQSVTQGIIAADGQCFCGSPHLVDEQQRGHASVDQIREPLLLLRCSVARPWSPCSITSSSLPAHLRRPLVDCQPARHPAAHTQAPSQACIFSQTPSTDQTK